MKKIITTIVIVAVTIAIVMFYNKPLNKDEVKIKKIELIPIVASDSIQNQNMHDLIAEYKTVKDETMNVVIGQSAKTHSCYLPESPLSNLIADILLTEARKVMPVDMAVTNVGGIRRDLFEGDITVGNVYEILPFDNSLLVMDYKGTDILDLADAIAKKGGESISGMTMKINKSQEAYDVKIGGKAIDTTKIYSVVSTDYLSWGNDQLQPLNRYIKSTPLNMMMRDAMLNYVKDATERGEKINCLTDKRIIIK